MSDNKDISVACTRNPPEAVVSLSTSPLQVAVKIEEVNPDGSLVQDTISGPQVGVKKESTICQRRLQIKLNRLPDYPLKFFIRDTDGNKPFKTETVLSLHSELDVKLEPEELKMEPPDTGEEEECDDGEELELQHAAPDDQLNVDPSSAGLKLKRTVTADAHFATDICDKKLATNLSLKVHIRTHTGDRNFACKLCDKKFAKSSHLMSHIRTHTGEKSITCFGQSFLSSLASCLFSGYYWNACRFGETGLYLY
ncbi:zinc-finger double domain-containing protein [Phthorimaea operculella]|nr:zinc-finger double domain-containing protein [Phthorimaea operculella]